MNWNLALLPVLALSTLVLASCESTGPAGGTVISNPNADEVTHMESQWGMKPRIVKPRLRPMEPGDLPENTTPTPNPTYSAEPESAPTAATPPPRLQEPVAPEAPTVDQATIQKLR
ncbi:hypothetical protein [Verrucomicrobium sp. BvORR106]|uniref:hypothetical protein n=1 Tax=Verrucomicrobium sp. BvORR106 TaxID=1403819 RepID=UPI0005711FC2|nr:hypothetical protein [Verrucomicrobium sp. BvORR106]